jgi:hypothetical protein
MHTMVLVGAPETRKGTIQWVHLCGKPTRMVWESWIKSCAICIGRFSSPWSSICRECHAEEGSGPYRGWQWAFKLDQEFRRRMLDSGRKMWHDYLIGANDPRATDAPNGHPG